jgi:hypothetical protein
MDSGHSRTQETHGCLKWRNRSVLLASAQQKHRRFLKVGLAVQISRGDGQEIEAAVIFGKFMALVLGPKGGPKAGAVADGFLVCFCPGFGRQHHRRK